MVVHAYGGPVLFVWAWLQGEAAVIVGGALAQQGYWPWWVVTLVACLPATIGHQIYFALGRRFGAPVLARLPARWQPALTRARALVQRSDRGVMLLMRFAYGIRLPLPILCGVAGIAPLRFFRYNVATALAWSLLFTGVGYGFGAAATAAFRRGQHVGSWILIGSIALGLSVDLLTRRVGTRVT